jgi:SPP1 family predicted phage head-tail adaptor
MESGRLNRRVMIQAPSVVQDEYGQPTSTFVTLATVWAAVEPLSGRQLFAARAAVSTVSVAITIRFLATVTTAMRVLYGNHIYGIDAIIDSEMAHESLILQCSELPA